jgi:hypothetical protein
MQRVNVFISIMAHRNVAHFDYTVSVMPTAPARADRPRTMGEIRQTITKLREELNQLDPKTRLSRTEPPSGDKPIEPLDPPPRPVPNPSIPREVPAPIKRTSGTDQRSFACETDPHKRLLAGRATVRRDFIRD